MIKLFNAITDELLARFYMIFASSLLLIASVFSPSLALSVMKRVSEKVDL